MVEFVFLKRALVTVDLKGKEFNGGRLLGHEGEGGKREGKGEEQGREGEKIGKSCLPGEVWLWL